MPEDDSRQAIAERACAAMYEHDYATQCPGILIASLTPPDRTRAVSTRCVGELLHNRHRRNVDLPLDAYYRVIDATTAELYAAGAGLSAHLAGGETAAPPEAGDPS